MLLTQHLQNNKRNNVVQFSLFFFMIIFQIHGAIPPLSTERLQKHQICRTDKAKQTHLAPRTWWFQTLSIICGHDFLSTTSIQRH